MKQRRLQVITDLSVSVKAGEIVAVVGSSGSGKSLLAHAILGILPSNAEVSGSLYFRGKPLTPQRQEALRGKEIALIPQSVNFLDPLMRVKHQVSSSKSDFAKQRDVFQRYGLKVEDGDLYPFQLSGGMARRVLVSTAVVSDASLIIADEPTPGLHPEALEEALKHFRELADEGKAVMLITHDLEAALKISDKIAVFYAGTTVEVAPVKDFSGEGNALRHPYSVALWKALPQNDFTPIPGHQPHPDALPPGCLFAPRCSKATSACDKARPKMQPLRGGRVRCIHVS